MEGINWIAIAVAAASTMVVGFVWYNPKIIGKELADAMNVGNVDANKGHKPWVYVLAVILSGVIAYKLNSGASHHPEDDQHFLHGVFHGIMTSLYLVAPVLITNMLFEARTMKIMLLHTTYWLVCFALMGGILYAFAGAGL